VYDFEGRGLKLREVLKVEVKKENVTEIPGLVGTDIPALVFVNNNDHAFVKCNLDPESLDFVLSKMDLITDAYLRQLLWNVLYDLTRDAKMKSTDYLKLVSTKIGIESDAKLVQTILTRSSATLSHFVPSSMISHEAETLFGSLYSLLEKATDKDFKLIWARYLVDFARSASAVGIIAEQLKKDNPVFTQEMRWGIVVRMVSWGLPGAEEVLEKEKERDKSDTGIRAALRAGTSVPKIEIKNEAWERFLNPQTKLSVHQSAAEMSGFRWVHQDSILVPFNEKFFSSLRSVFESRDKEFCNSFFYSLFPMDPENPEILKRSKEILAQLEPKEKHLAKTLNEEIDDIERDLKCRQLVLGLIHN